MSQELMYTSAPQGLKPGSRGFCTVAATAGMAPPLLALLESLSGYRHVYPPQDPNAALNPVVYSHVRTAVGARRLHVLSRIAAAGMDYTQRTNKFAHHVVLDLPELPPGGPAWLLARPGFMESGWDGPPRVLAAGRTPPMADDPPGVCRAWEQATGDAGWGGSLAATALAESRTPVYLVFRPGMDMLRLLAEALALLPPDSRWGVTFSTYFTRLPAGIDCLWRCVLDGSPEADAARRTPHTRVIDLCRPLGAAPDSPWVEAARGRAVAPPSPTMRRAVITAADPEAELSFLQSSAPAVESSPARPAAHVPSPVDPNQPPPLLPPQIGPPSRPRRFKSKPKRIWPIYVGVGAGIALMAAAIVLAVNAWNRGENATPELAQATAERPASAPAEPPPKNSPVGETPKAEVPAKSSESASKPTKGEDATKHGAPAPPPLPPDKPSEVGKGGQQANNAHGTEKAENLRGDGDSGAGNHGAASSPRKPEEGTEDQSQLPPLNVTPKPGTPDDHAKPTTDAAQAKVPRRDKELPTDDEVGELLAGLPKAVSLPKRPATRYVPSSGKETSDSGKGTIARGNWAQQAAHFTLELLDGSELFGQGLEKEAKSGSTLWKVQLRSDSSGKGATAFACFAFTNVGLTFSWEPESSGLANAEYLRNCILRVKPNQGQGKPKMIRLREPEEPKNPLIFPDPQRKESNVDIGVSDLLPNQSLYVEPLPPESFQKPEHSSPQSREEYWQLRTTDTPSIYYRFSLEPQPNSKPQLADSKTQLRVRLKYEGVDDEGDDWSDVKAKKVGGRLLIGNAGQVKKHQENLASKIRELGGQKSMLGGDKAQSDGLQNRINELSKKKQDAAQLLKNFDNINKSRLEYRVYMKVGDQQVDVIKTNGDSEEERPPPPDAVEEP